MVNFMFCVNNSENIIIINKSKFITNIFYINNLNDINIYLNKIKEKYKDATHHCYAYIINNTKRFNDDGEPNGTAGMPILDCLEKNKLNHTLCIVTRYFGGIKLGAGTCGSYYEGLIKNGANFATISVLEYILLPFLSFSFINISI